MDARPFFRPELWQEVIRCGVKLGLTYRTNPLQFLEMPTSSMSELWRITVDLIEERNEGDG